MSQQTPAVLFVCLGNICRSPMAEGLARKRFAEAALDVEIDSAGTGNWHLGEPPDRRAMNASWKVLVDISDLRARQIEPGDFERFHYIIAMDDTNLAALTLMSGGNYRGRLSRILDFAAQEGDEIPDPYYGGHDGFDQVLVMLEAGIDGLIRHIREAS